MLLLAIAAAAGWLCGVAPEAKAGMDVLARRLAAEYPDEVSGTGEFALGTGITVVASKHVRIHPQADAPIMTLASLVLVVVGLVLAIACSNLATLLLVRGAARAKEISVQLAMGARRHQLVLQLLTESLLLSAAARSLRVGYAVDGVAMLETDLRFAGYSEHKARAVYDDLLRRIETVPGVESAALLRGLPMGSQ